MRNIRHKFVTGIGLSNFVEMIGIDRSWYMKKEHQSDVLLRRARDGTRTRGPDLGKVVLHQLSHSRIL